MIIQIFEILVILLSIIILSILQKYDKKSMKRYILIAIGVLIFELFTQPLWNNRGLDFWAYIYHDVSWILTLGWSSIIILSMFIVDKYVRIKETKKFFLYLLISGIFSIFAEALVLYLGIRQYSPEIYAVMSKIYIPILNVPIETLYYIPVFIALIIGFARYFEMSFKKELKVLDNLTKSDKRRRRKK